PIKPNEKLKIPETNSILTVPSNLPENTTIIIKDVTNDTNVPQESGLIVAGTVLSINLNNQDIDANDPFMLTMEISDDIDLTKYDVDIYYYDEISEKWIKQNGAIDKINRTITINPIH